VYIDQFRNPWWLKPVRPNNIPDPPNYETDYED
jgi:hypothetical protein